MAFPLAGVTAQIVSFGGEGCVGLDKPHLGAAIEPPPVNSEAVERYAIQGGGDGVRQLNFTADAGNFPVQVIEDFGLQDIAPDDRQCGGGRIGVGFFDFQIRMLTVKTI